MKKFFGIVAIGAFALAAINAQASDNSYPMQAKAQRAHKSSEYWNGKVEGNASSSFSESYNFLTTQEARNSKRNSDYFNKIGHKSGTATKFNKFTDVSEYPFSGGTLSAKRGGYVYLPSRN